MHHKPLKSLLMDSLQRMAKNSLMQKKIVFREKRSRPNVVSENTFVQRRSARLGLVLRPHQDLTWTSPRPHKMSGCYLYVRSRLGLENRPNVVKHPWEQAIWRTRLGLDLFSAFSPLGSAAWLVQELLPGFRPAQTVTRLQCNHIHFSHNGNY